MKVTNQTQNQLQNVAAKKADKAKSSGPGLDKVKSNQTDSAAGASEVAMSSRARDMQKIKDIAMKSTPDVDEAKVAKYQQLIDSGKYKVDARAVAERLVDEHLNMAGSDTE